MHGMSAPSPPVVHGLEGEVNRASSPYVDVQLLCTIIVSSVLVVQFVVSSALVPCLTHQSTAVRGETTLYFLLCSVYSAQNKV